MPFNNHAAYRFDLPSVSALPPGRNGVYGLYVTGKWIYVGKGDIRERLMAHLNGDNPCIKRETPTNFIFEVTASMDSREKQLIVEFDPVCNKRVG